MFWQLYDDVDRPVVFDVQWSLQSIHVNLSIVFGVQVDVSIVLGTQVDRFIDFRV